MCHQQLPGDSILEPPLFGALLLFPVDLTMCHSYVVALVEATVSGRRNKWANVERIRCRPRWPKPDRRPCPSFRRVLHPFIVPRTFLRHPLRLRLRLS